MNPEFLTLSEVLEIHADQIRRFGGRLGIRDMGLLQSAVAMPEAGFGEDYLHSDLFEMAAAYLFHIVQNHPFVDGNQRTGAVAALVFFHLNDVEITVDDDALERRVRGVAAGKMRKETVADFFRRHAERP